MLKKGRSFRHHSFCKMALIAALAPLPLFAAPLPDSAKVDFEFELPKIDTSMYARPYVALWIEDEKRKPVKTIQLWVGKDEWLKDLRSWWRKVGRYDRELVDAVTSATRPAGQYRFVWDGTNDDGQRIEQGDYTLHVEVVREHGGRNYLRQKIQLADKEARYQIKPTEETGVITVNYQVK
ncbi:DUF2271 domain-containing protein [Vibrio campbellii]|uniref:DUF2271 domain-containing protein n=1 Tax=Vibrio campbellii TaxID=680 RepID=A0AAQ3B3C9_9VIBR|nr:DUF2271 domain-containing protein [Vibrio campbellii]WDG10971.1 DUF2271 domain-containing protein [Vibrio campbellii]